jgi:hypothetical protein
MKIVLKESQYNKLVDRYLTSQFEPHEVKTQDSTDTPIKMIWERNNHTLVEFDTSNIAWVSREIWSSLEQMFDLKYNEVENHIKNWFNKHYNIEGLKIYKLPLFVNIMIQQ